MSVLRSGRFVARSNWIVNNFCILWGYKSISGIVMRIEKLLKQHYEITGLQHQLYKEDLKEKLTYYRESKNKLTTTEAELKMDDSFTIEAIISLLVGIMIGVAFTI